MHEVLASQSASARFAIQSGASSAPFRKGLVAALKTRVERRDDGSLILSSDNPVQSLEQRSFSEFLPKWAKERGSRLAFCERDGQGHWRSLTWAQLWVQVQSAAAGMLEMGLGRGQRLMVLSGNSIEQAVLLLAAEHVGIPVALVSPAYSLRGGPDFSRLKDVFALCPPAALFVQSVSQYQQALSALGPHALPVLAVEGAGAGVHAWEALTASVPTRESRARVESAHAAIRDEDTSRVLFTSGSTGSPKGVVTNYGATKFLLGFVDSLFSGLTTRAAVYLDWLPWHHAFGLLVNFNRSVLTGGTHYIDDGRPLPELFGRTVRNLREVSPTMFSNVPSAWALLAAELERDGELARSFFSKVVVLGYGGASLPRDVWQRIQAVAEKTVGERIQFQTGLASTETAASGTVNVAVGEDMGNIGVPSPGSQVKLVPLEGDEGRYELRVRLPFQFTGYLQRPDLTAAALDEEGFFRIGDAVRLADPADPSKGLHFSGRVVEDFKLINGTWVRTGAVRLALVELCAPLVSDAVICGHDQAYVGALAWPDIQACRGLAPELALLEAKELMAHPMVVNEISRRLASQKGASSTKVARVMFMADPPSLDANEIADKGYVNQARTRERRAHLVEALFATQAGACVATAGR